MIYSSKLMQSIFDSKGPSQYYHWCVDIELAGEDYKVNEIIFFIKDVADPFSNFIHIKKYDDGFLLIGIYTDDSVLIDECFDYVYNIASDFNEIELRTPHYSVIKNRSISERFEISDTSEKPNPVYYLRCQKDLISYKNKENIKVSLLSSEDIEEIKKGIDDGLLDAESMSVENLKSCINFKDVKVYILRVCNQIAGYLRAECGYKNIYDIGWVYVDPKYRGNGYGADLVSYFSGDLVTQGLVPHYGYAITKESARVAEKCGYICDDTIPYCKTLKLKKTE